MFRQDLKYAIRSLIFDRGITAVVIVCLALGIGINATLFSVIDGVLIQPLHLLARTVIVTDKDGVVRYMQVVPEITELPDMDAVMQAAKALL